MLRSVDPAAFKVVLIEMDGQVRAEDKDPNLALILSLTLKPQANPNPNPNPNQVRAKDEEVHRRLLAAKLVHRADLNLPNSRVYVRPDLAATYPVAQG